MKKTYKKPILRECLYELKYGVLDGSVTDVGGGSGIGYGGGGSGDVHVKERGSFGDLWSMEDDDIEIVIDDEEI